MRGRMFNYPRYPPLSQTHVIASSGLLTINSIRMMKHKQKQPWGCGLYAVANTCNLDNFITEERLEKSKTGIVIGATFKMDARRWTPILH
jgi:hypothetical protein